MGLDVLVPLVMGALLKVAGKVGEGVLGAVEEAVKDNAVGVFAKIKEWWSGDSSASDDLAKFEAEPDIYQPVVQARLVKKLTAEPEKQAELAAMMAQAGPQVEVFQTIAAAHGITGAKVEEMMSGRLNVVQDVQNASDVTGAEIKRMG
jgi:hypothetical protein